MTIMPVMTKDHAVMAISDTAMGYGSPQIPAFIQSVAAHYNTRAFVIETDETHRPSKRPENADRLDIMRSVSGTPSWSRPAHCERNQLAYDMMEANRPDVVILFSPLQLAAVKRLSYKPKCVILYLLELYDHVYRYTLGPYGHLVDHLIVPEYERLKHVLSEFFERSKTKSYPKSHIIYNTSFFDKSEKPIAGDKRNKRVIYTGTLCRNLTLSHEFLGDDLKDLPIDIYGNFSVFDDDIQKDMMALPQSEKVQYKGYISLSELRVKMKEYAFSFVRWNPDAGLNFKLACPNKFFEALALGIPPISAPHPQAKQIIEKYKCGILASGFEAEHMKDAIEKGLSLIGTPAYDEMVKNAQRAYKKNFNWEAQFNRFAPSLATIEIKK